MGEKERVRSDGRPDRCSHTGQIPCEKTGHVVVIDSMFTIHYIIPNSVTKHGTVSKKQI